MMEMDAARDPRLGLETRDIGRDEIAAATVKHFPKREQGRQDRRRGMAAKRVADIVKIERMRRGAVDERRIERCGPLTAAENETFAAGFAESEHPGGDPRAGVARGVLYSPVGASAAIAAIWPAHRPAGPIDAVQLGSGQLDHGHPIGAIFLIAVAFGLACLAGWFTVAGLATAKHADARGWWRGLGML